MFDFTGPVNINVHLPERSLAELHEKLDRIERKQDEAMSKYTEISELLSAMDAATNEIASDIDALREQVAGGLTPEQATDVTAKLDAMKSRLVALGQDPEDPVPAPTE